MHTRITPQAARRSKPAAGALAAVALALFVATPTLALAQLSSPMGEGSVAAPQGSGAGYHSPNSPFAPLTERSDVLPWSLLTAVKTKTEKSRILPVFSPSLKALDQKSQRVQGFMMPLDPGEKQKHFLISSVPLSCSFCLPGGPESLVEVRTKTAVKYSLEPVVVEGKFSVLADDPYGMYYRMTEAVAVK